MFAVFSYHFSIATFLRKMKIEILMTKDKSKKLIFLKDFSILIEMTNKSLYLQKFLSS